MNKLIEAYLLSEMLEGKQIAHTTNRLNRNGYVEEYYAINTDQSLKSILTTSWIFIYNNRIELYLVERASMIAKLYFEPLVREIAIVADMTEFLIIDEPVKLIEVLSNIDSILEKIKEDYLKLPIVEY